MRYVAGVAGIALLCVGAYVIYKYYKRTPTNVQRFIPRQIKMTTTSRNISENGKQLIANQEGLRLTVYKDVAGYWTIGRGHKVVPGDNIFPYGKIKTITREQADALFNRDILNIAVRPINSLVKVPLTQNQFDALCSLVYNMGSGNFAKSSLLVALNRGDFSSVASQFVKYNKTGTPLKENSALTARRQTEANLFIS